jgi:DNA polymerase I-like protein with 3'-5' exonuclease and polymerase domains
VVDLETTNIEKGSALNEDNRLVLGCWWTPTRGLSSCRGGEYEQDELIRACEGADFIIAHNAKFELQWLRRCGLRLEDTLVYDTQIAEYVIGGNRWQLNSLSLDACLERNSLPVSKLSTVSLMIRSGICPSEIPSDWLLKYCTMDVMACLYLYRHQINVMEETRLLPIVYSRCLATPALADIEFNGMQLDSEAVLEMWDVKERELAELEHKLDEFTGGINWNSPTQVTEYLYDELGFAEARDYRGNEIRTATGNRSAGIDTIQRLRPTNAKQRDFLELYLEAKSINNELTKYLRKFRNCVEEAGGFLQGSFNQCNTQTHRLSSSGLRYRTQFQNFPRSYKPVFMARDKGWLVGEADGAQLEFRVAAHLGRDDDARADIESGTDIHQVTADIIGCSRQLAKAHTFKPLYGGKSGTKEERNYYKFFSEKYGGISSTQQEWIDTVLLQKWLETEWGMRYYWPNTRMERSGFVVNTTSICNYPVQALATAEIIPIALVYFWHKLKRSDLKMFIVNTVHDSIIVELPESEIEDFHELSKQCFMEDVYRYLSNVYDMDFTVPLATGIKTAPRWGATEEETTYTMEI